MIQAENLTKRYGRHVALDAVNFSIGKGEILGFLGPNGAGKSTAMNIITGYLSASEGEVRVNGMNVLEQPEEVKRTIGYLPEQPPLYPEMTVDEYLKFVSELKQIGKEQYKQDIEKIMDLVKIGDVRGRLIRNLSKGYKQRVGLGQALIGNPSLLILDEPTVGLDPKQIIEIRNLIQSLGREHTIVLSSHILPEVSAVCERVLIINKGRIVAGDSPENLSRALAGTGRLAVRLAGSEKAATAAVKMIAGLREMRTQGSAETGTIDLLLEAEKDQDIREDLFNACVKASLPILMMRPMDMTLEDIFLHLTTDEAATEEE